MKYVVFTTKHHDGFNMYDTQYSDYKITDVECPFHTDAKDVYKRQVFHQGAGDTPAFPVEQHGFGAAGAQVNADYIFHTTSVLSPLFAKRGLVCTFFLLFSLFYKIVSREETRFLQDISLRWKVVCVILCTDSKPRGFPGDSQKIEDGECKMERYDGVVIGAGVVGSGVARGLSRREGRFLVVERALDVCEGTSKANSAIIHAGFDAEPGTWKAKMNVRGNRMMDKLAEELDIPFKRVGAFVVCLSEEDLPKLRDLYDRGVKNGVTDMELLTGDQARALEPNLSEGVAGALLAKTSGIVCPFELTLGMAESAAKNGVEFSFDTQVTGLERREGVWVVHTSKGDVEARAVVNAAGVFGDTVHNWVCEEKLHITPRRGEYCLLDRTAGDHVSHTVFQLPGKYGKGVLVSPTAVSYTHLDVYKRQASSSAISDFSTIL